MGKRLSQQRRGRGTGSYKSPSHKHTAAVKYPLLMEPLSCEVVDIVDAPGRTAPLCILNVNGKKEFLPAIEGLHTGQKIEFYGSSKKGNIVKLEDVQEGARISNIEIYPNDGGKLCRSGGSSAVVVSHTGNKTTVQLPSKKMKTLSSKCRATVGSVSNSGRVEKPFMKAGKKFYLFKTKAGIFPKVSAIAMNALDHPFGGSAKPGKHKTVSKDMPPGKKVGNISAKKSGKKK